MSIQNRITDTLNKSEKLFKDGFAAQGHNLSGSTSESWAVTIQASGDRITFQVHVSKVALIQHYGIKKENIPFSGVRQGGSRGGYSAYIEGLKKYGKDRKGLNDKEALNFAFAVAYIHKYKDGMQTENSKRYSKTGERKGFFNNVFTHVDVDIVMEIDNEVEVIFNKFN